LHQRNLALRHRRQVATAEQIGQVVAAILDFDVAVEHRSQQGLDAINVRGDLADHPARLGGLFARLTQHGQQFTFDGLGQLLNLGELGRVFKEHRGLVLQPHAKLRLVEALRAALTGFTRRLPVVLDQDLLRPLQQLRLLPFAFSLHVLAQEEQPIGFVRPCDAVGVARVGRIHDVDGQIDHFVHVEDGLGQLLPRHLAVRELLGDGALEHARALARPSRWTRRLGHALRPCEPAPPPPPRSAMRGRKAAAPNAPLKRAAGG
jgi:hypothetical protein